VEGRPAVYAVGGGDGPPVVFLHGWALGSHAYKRAMRRLTSRGCRVFAPALPSFGDTADLPSDAMSIEGYAGWVASFIKEVEISEPALVIGHSFGGGVAIKFACDNPELVRYLILLNALGGGNRRPPWEWAIGVGTEFWPPSGAVEMLQAMRGDLVPNLLRNPLGVLRVGLLALATDLRDEMEELRQLGVPVLALTSEKDRLIPRSAFETVCDSVGADRRVVSGGHAWLLVDPDLFDEVLASTIDVQVEEHRATKTADRKSEIERLLQRSHLTKRDVRAFLENAAPLWLLSDSASALAGDLALCRPAVKKSEVRASARRIEGSNSLRLTIVARDRSGLLADITGVLTANGLSISSAAASAWKKQKVAVLAFIVEADRGLDKEAWAKLGDRLRKMVASAGGPWPTVGPLGSVFVTAQGAGGRSMVKVTAPDEDGLLSTICRCFHVHGVNIETLRARTSDGVAQDTFLVVTDIAPEALQEGIEDWLSDPGAREQSLGLVQDA
jgi:pimeloyl-ACP methyl ester carboxylesterase/glycine cleavage system regulatory protein